MKIEPPLAPLFDTHRAIALAQETLDIEAAAVLGLKRHINAAFVQVVGLMLTVQGRVVVMGMGQERPYWPKNRGHSGLYWHACDVCTPSRSQSR